jgi:hypothetical protein
LNRGEAKLTLRDVQAKTSAFASSQLFSAVTKAGVDEARQRVLAILADPEQQEREA